MTLDDINLDIQAVMDKSRSVPEQFAHISAGDLRGLTEEIYARLDEATAGAENVTFIPEDPQADAAEGGEGWNLAHVVVHLTAGLEENAAQASTLARGAEITGRPRHEIDWESVTTMEQIRRRLAESRRITLAFLETWPDAPHLDATYEHPFFGEMTALTYHLAGINHAKGHLAQIEEIRRQEAARAGEEAQGD